MHRGASKKSMDSRVSGLLGDGKDDDSDDSITELYERRNIRQNIKEKRALMREHGEVPSYHTIIPKRLDTMDPTARTEKLETAVDSYQDIMKTRLARLGYEQYETDVPEDSNPVWSQTMDPARAVREGVMHYHETCEQIGQLYAEPGGRRDDMGLQPLEKMAVHKLITNLKDGGPDIHNAFGEMKKNS